MAGKPHKFKRDYIEIKLSLAPEYLQELDRQAYKLGMCRGDLIRDALSKHVQTGLKPTGFKRDDKGQ